MWFDLASDFTETGCEENPFGPGLDYGTNVANQSVPRMERIGEVGIWIQNDPDEMTRVPPAWDGDEQWCSVARVSEAGSETCFPAKCRRFRC
jgi:hypothetical protein